MVKELYVHENYLVKNIKNALIERIDRGKKNLVGLLRFLDNPSSFQNDDT